MMTHIRLEKPSDIEAIESVITAAFENAPHADHNEAAIVADLRKANALTLSLVVELDGNIVGHIAASPVSITDGTDTWFGIGPLAVIPTCQGFGIGSKLLLSALVELKKLGAGGCVLVGDPEYYNRFGFKAVPTLTYSGAPPEYFMGLQLLEAWPEGEVTYHPAFG